MPRESGGSGQSYSRESIELIRASFGPQMMAPLNLNRATSQELAAHPQIGKQLATRLLRFRKKKRIGTPADLYHAGLIDRNQLRKLDASAFGSTLIRPLLTSIEIEGSRLYVGEPFALQFTWLAPSKLKPVILSVDVRFPSGFTSKVHIRLSEQDLEAGRLHLPGFSSGESGEFYVLATLRDEAGGGIPAQRTLWNIHPKPGSDFRYSPVPYSIW